MSASAAGSPVGVDAHLRLQAVDEQHVPAEPPEAEQVLEEDPGVAAVLRPLGQRAGDDYRLAHGPAHGVGVVSAPTVIVSGMIAATPWQGGAAWAVLQYLLGLRRLGCERVLHRAG